MKGFSNSWRGRFVSSLAAIGTVLFGASGTTCLYGPIELPDPNPPQPQAPKPTGVVYDQHGWPINNTIELPGINDSLDQAIVLEAWRNPDGTLIPQNFSVELNVAGNGPNNNYINIMSNIAAVEIAGQHVGFRPIVTNMYPEINRQTFDFHIEQKPGEIVNKGLYLSLVYGIVDTSYNSFDVDVDTYLGVGMFIDPVSSLFLDVLFWPCWPTPIGWLVPGYVVTLTQDFTVTPTDDNQLIGGIYFHVMDLPGGGNGNDPVDPCLDGYVGHAFVNAQGQVLPALNYNYGDLPVTLRAQLYLDECTAATLNTNPTVNWTDYGPSPYLIITGISGVTANKGCNAGICTYEATATLSGTQVTPPVNATIGNIPAAEFTAGSIQDVASQEALVSTFQNN